MKSFAERYHDGQHQQVWTELCQLEEKVWDECIFEDAKKVAALAVERCIKNISLIRSRLDQLGYRFKRPDHALVFAGTDQTKRLNEFEATYGRMPLFLRTWFEAIESLDFSQERSQLRAPTTGWASGLGCHARLVVLSLEDAEANWRQFREEGCYIPPPPKTMFFGLGSCCSNNDPVGVDLPEARFDCVVAFEERRTFRDLLNDCFAWGGFPFYQHYPDGKHPLKSLYGQPDFAVLLPVLREGLLEI